MQQHDDTAEIIMSFLDDIGIPIVRTRIDGETFLPGIRVVHGTLHVDRSKLTFPGDLLHEGGHLAVIPKEFREHAEDDDVGTDKPGVIVEVEAMAWSYAAALHLGIDPREVFHEGGYHGQSEAILLSFSMGVYLGASGLQDAGMATVGQRAVELDIPPFPHIIKWLRD